MDSRQCSRCKRSFPLHLVNEMATGNRNSLRYRAVCPLCALKIMQEHHGDRCENFAPGSQAQAMLEEAREHVKKGGA